MIGFIFGLLRRKASNAARGLQLINFKPFSGTAYVFLFCHFIIFTSSSQAHNEHFRQANDPFFFSFLPYQSYNKPFPHAFLLGKSLEYTSIRFIFEPLL